MTAPTAMNWNELGRAAREAADDAFDGIAPHVDVAYTFLCDNPACFGCDEWPVPMPPEPNIEFIAAYYRALEAGCERR